MTLFSNITGVSPNYCLIKDDGVAFLVPKGMIGKCVGKGGSNIKKLRGKIGKNVYVFEKSPSEDEFIKKSLNVASPLTQESERNNKKVIYIKLNASDKYSMRRGAVLMFAKELFRELFGKEIKIQQR